MILKEMKSNEESTSGAMDTYIRGCQTRSFSTMHNVPMLPKAKNLLSGMLACLQSLFQAVKVRWVRWHAC